MTNQEAVQSLIQYLQALTEVQRNGDVKVFTEIKRTIEKIEKLLND